MTIIPAGQPSAITTHLPRRSTRSTVAPRAPALELLGRAALEQERVVHRRRRAAIRPVQRRPQPPHHRLDFRQLGHRAPPSAKSDAFYQHRHPGDSITSEQTSVKIFQNPSNFS